MIDRPTHDDDKSKPLVEGERIMTTKLREKSAGDVKSHTETDWAPSF